MSSGNIELDEIHSRLIFRLFQTSNVMHRSGTLALNSVGVTSQQWSVLGALSRPKVEEGMTVNDMCRYLMVSRQNLSIMLNRLEAAGYVMRAQDKQDQRSKRIMLTVSGREALNEINRLMQVFFEKVMKGLSRDDQISCVHYLTRLRDNMSID
ncbi:MAG: MarR family transcriptional regulator [Pseudomonadales bacterium]|nr:MarR family transcriptional regulator [Pseudomonadales bacterium]MCP5213760.1 MarR family transcriptional regulator [Pseudomonadales bacterium]